MFPSLRESVSTKQYGLAWSIPLSLACQPLRHYFSQNEANESKKCLKKKKMRRIVIGNTHHLPPSPEEIVHFCKFRHFCQRGKQQPQSCSIPEYQTPPPRNSTNLPCADKLEVAFRHPRDAPRNRDSLPCYLEIL